MWIRKSIQAWRRSQARNPEQQTTISKEAEMKSTETKEKVYGRGTDTEAKKKRKGCYKIAPEYRAVIDAAIAADAVTPSGRRETVSCLTNKVMGEIYALVVRQDKPTLKGCPAAQTVQTYISKARTELDLAVGVRVKVEGHPKAMSPEYAARLATREVSVAAEEAPVEEVVQSGTAKDVAVDQTPESSRVLRLGDLRPGDSFLVSGSISQHEVLDSEPFTNVDGVLVQGCHAKHGRTVCLPVDTAVVKLPRSSRPATSGKKSVKAPSTNAAKDEGDGIPEDNRVFINVVDRVDEIYVKRHATEKAAAEHAHGLAGKYKRDVVTFVAYAVTHYRAIEFVRIGTANSRQEGFSKEAK